MDTGEMILRAARLAEDAHRGQYRKWGHTQDPYIWHPMRVAGMVMLVEHVTSEMIQAAFLHDSLEDTKLKEEDLVKAGFGGEVVYFVKALTNPSKGLNLPRAERKAMDRKHIDKAPWGAKVIKLADRLDNLLEIRNDPETPKDFVETYKGESRLLLTVLKGINDELENMLAKLVE